MTDYVLELRRFEDGSGGYVVRRTRDDQRLYWRTLPRGEGLESINVVGESRRIKDLQDDSFRPGQELALVPEPENPYDPNAIAVWNADRTFQAGYIPANEAVRIGKKLADGQHRCYSMWEMFDANGRRVSLRILLLRDGASVSWEREGEGGIMNRTEKGQANG